jgi:hypothetical protein
MSNFIFDLNDNMEPFVPDEINTTNAPAPEEISTPSVSAPEVVEIFSSDEDIAAPVTQYFMRDNFLDPAPSVFLFYGTIVATEEQTTR